MARIGIVLEAEAPGRTSLPGLRRIGPGRLRKVALLGNHESRAFAPWDDESWEIWAHTSCKGQAPRVDRYFDLHPKVWWEAEKNWKKGYRAWLARNRTPILMQEQYPEVPASVRYPKERILAEFRRYFTSQAAWMIALALTEGVTHIGLWGIAYQHWTEYATQRAGCEYWIGVAEGRGVQIVIPEQTPLCRTPSKLYGYESHDAEGLHQSYKDWPKPKPATVKVGPREATLIDMDSPDGRPPLMVPPIPGIAPAWERSGHAHHV